jgi:hypothetical protein
MKRKKPDINTKTLVIQERNPTVVDGIRTPFCRCSAFVGIYWPRCVRRQMKYIYMINAVNSTSKVAATTKPDASA